MTRYTNNIIIILTLLCTLLTACDEIDDNERVIEREASLDDLSTVLIEDFTGQRCVNCPSAHAELERIHQQYGHDKAIVVAIHGGPLAVYTNSRMNGLRNSLADEYYNHWEPEGLPMANINRSSLHLYNYTLWQDAAFSEMIPAPKADIRAELVFDKQTDKLIATVSAKSRTSSLADATLQVWIVEDGIVAPQLRYVDALDKSKGETLDTEYVHNHVLRAAMNGTWGTPITLSAEEWTEETFNMDASPEWNTDNLYVVTFITVDNKVQAVTQAKIQ